jgi:hypothetical protein
VAFAYAPALWQEFFSVVSLAAATLTGLLAVALSLNVRAVAASPARIGRARESLVALTVLQLVSIFVLIPQQGRVALGAELVVLDVAVLSLVSRLQSMTVHRLPVQNRRRWTIRIVLGTSVTVVIGISGVSLIVGRHGGLLWLIPVALYGLIWPTFNAWILTIHLPGELEGEPSP